MAAQRFSRRWLLVSAGAAAIVGVSAVQLPATARLLGGQGPIAIIDIDTATATATAGNA